MKVFAKAWQILPEFELALSAQMTRGWTGAKSDTEAISILRGMFESWETLGHPVDWLRVAEISLERWSAEKSLLKFIDAMDEQLRNDDARWGDTWLKRTRKGQEERTAHTFENYFDKYENAGHPINWLAVAGNALICWYREQHPEIWPE